MMTILASAPNGLSRDVPMADFVAPVILAKRAVFRLNSEQRDEQY